MQILATKQIPFTPLKNIVMLPPSAWVGYAKHYMLVNRFNR